jgi:hypothetical protein
VCLSPKPHPVPPLDRILPPIARGGEHAIDIAAWDYTVRLTPGEPGPGRPAWAGTGVFAPNPYSFDSILRVLWAYFLNRDGGALIHACGVRRDGVGVLFPGVSGTGKSTLARKLEDPRDVLSDEIIPVRFVPDGAWRIHASPFWGEFQRGGDSLRGWPLSVIVFLRKGSGLSVSPLAPPEATRRLLETLVCFEPGEAVIAPNLAWAARLCSGVPCVEATTAVDTPTAALFRALAPWTRKAAASRDGGLTNRESIADVRAALRRAGRSALVARGSSMRPVLRDGDTLFVEPLGARDASPGDVVVVWMPGETPDGDRLVNHRLVSCSRGPGGVRVRTKGDAASGIESFVDGREAEVLGRVVAVGRDGRTRPVPGRLGRLALLAGSLAVMPLQRLRRAVRSPVVPGTPVTPGTKSGDVSPPARGRMRHHERSRP